jgi:hypothetical protein
MYAGLNVILSAVVGFIALKLEMIAKHQTGFITKPPKGNALCKILFDFVVNKRSESWSRAVLRRN